MSVPLKYRQIGDFHRYYSGECKAPYLTIFVGGNHEASNYLAELYYGGWVAPNIYYMGAANVLRLGPLRIAGLSGIWKGHDYKKPHHERLPYSQDEIKSIYHVRELDVRKLLQVRMQVDVGVSHDWPRSVEWHGNWKQLFRWKDLFEADARSGKLGSEAAKLVMERLRPRHWFSAHLHCKYPAVVDWRKDGLSSKEQRAANAMTVPAPPGDGLRSQPTDSKVEADVANQSLGPQIRDEPNDHVESGTVERSTPGETLESENSVSEDLRALLPAAFRRSAKSSNTTSATHPPGIANKVTNFLALDKVLPGRDFLQLLELPVAKNSEMTRPFKLEYDEEWLAITRVFADELTYGNPDAPAPRAEDGAHFDTRIQDEERWVQENVVKAGRQKVPENFAVTAPRYDPKLGERLQGQPREYNNPQTKDFCNLLQIRNPFDASAEEIEERFKNQSLVPGPRPDGGGPSRYGRGRAGGFGGRGRGGQGRGRGR